MKKVTEQKEKPTKLNLNSQFMKTFLTLLATFLVFAGPTYVVYALSKAAEIDYAISVVTGIALFVVGLVLIRYLIRNKVIT